MWFKWKCSFNHNKVASSTVDQVPWPSLLVNSQGLFQNTISGDWIHSKSSHFLNHVTLILNRSFIFVIDLGRYQTLYFQMSISGAIHILFPQILPISKRLAIRKIQRKRRNVKRNQKMTKKEISKNRPISLTIPMHVHAQSFLPGEYGHHQKVE